MPSSDGRRTSYLHTYVYCPKKGNAHVCTYTIICSSTYEFRPRAGVQVVLEEVAQAFRPAVPAEHVHRPVVDGARVEVPRSRHVSW